ncbi:hypothetical protein FHW37_11947 [Neorhizobium alkalisoli]|uniref:Uncharacterized protein n=1 Tax=Neorhizobium alkalisoli TaxID=528178 RepID=A0A561PZC7_9HYPH|nr:hypothetical protein FHW37_11947 [Neorhizobium alkalisoli]
MPQGPWRITRDPLCMRDGKFDHASQRVTLDRFGQYAGRTLDAINDHLRIGRQEKSGTSARGQKATDFWPGRSIKQIDVHKTDIYGDLDAFGFLTACCNADHVMCERGSGVL